MKYYTQEKGFVVLFTILISSIVLLMALGITSIATKEVTLSIQSRDAAKAFFAADAGMECALYQDRVSGIFTGSTPQFGCNDMNGGVQISGNFPIYVFYVSVGIDYDSCVRVTVNKEHDDLDGDGNYRTRIEALGYNTKFNNDQTLDCGENSQNPRRVERGYRATY